MAAAAAATSREAWGKRGRESRAAPSVLAPFPPVAPVRAMLRVRPSVEPLRPSVSRVRACDAPRPPVSRVRPCVRLSRHVASDAATLKAMYEVTLAESTKICKHVQSVTTSNRPSVLRESRSAPSSRPFRQVRPSVRGTDASFPLVASVRAVLRVWNR
jgi:hypothetical protein